MRLLLKTELRLLARGWPQLMIPLFFSLLVIVVGSICFINIFDSLSHQDLNTKQYVANAIFWLAFLFSSHLVISRRTLGSRQSAINGICLLAGISPEKLFLVKVISNLLLILLLALFSWLSVLLLFNLMLANIVTCLIVTVIAAWGLSIVGSFCIEMVAQQQLRNLLLPVVFYPLSIPLVIPAIDITRAAMTGEQIATLSPLSFMVGFVTVLTSVAIMFCNQGFTE